VAARRGDWRIGLAKPLNGRSTVARAFAAIRLACQAPKPSLWRSSALQIRLKEFSLDVDYFFKARAFVGTEMPAVERNELRIW